MELTEEPSVGRPDITQYDDYRAYLAAFYRYKKAARAGFSFRLFASRAKIKSPNYLQLVIQGKRNLSDEKAPLVAKAMSLAPSEALYFTSLVKLSNSDDEAMENEARRDLLVATKALVAKRLHKDQIDVLSRWYVLLIRELVFLPDFEFSGDWVALKLGGLISVEAATAALKLLERSGFLIRTDGRWRAADPVLDTGPEGFAETPILALHEETLKVWSEQLASFDPGAREMGLVNIPIRREDIPEFQRRIRRFQDEVIGWLQAIKNPDSLVQLGVYLIPIVLKDLSGAK